MTDLEISKQLALAIGWKETDIAMAFGDIGVFMEETVHARRFRIFDYRDWATIGPIAERYDCFPRKRTSTYLWWAWVGDGIPQRADTPQKAIALAVIEGAKT